jgi:hypothetical protein
MTFIFLGMFSYNELRNKVIQNDLIIVGNVSLDTSNSCLNTLRKSN